MSTHADHAEITQLVYRLYACLDEGRFDDLSDVFTADATARTPGGTAEGREAVIAQAARNHSRDDRVQHLTHNLLVDVAGDEAAVRADVIVALSDAAAPEGRLAPEPRTMISGRFHFTAARSPQGWLLSSVSSTPVWARGTLPQPAARA